MNYKVLTRIAQDSKNKIYLPGDEIELKDLKLVEKLLKNGVIEPLLPKKVKKNKKNISSEVAINGSVNSINE